MAMNNRLLRPLATGFNPKSISGLELWLDAADAGNVVTTGSPARVSSWRDKSGNNRHADNSVAGSTQPLYVAAAQKGKNVVRGTQADNTVLTIPSSAAAFNFLHNGTPSFVAFASTFGTSSDPNQGYCLLSNFNTVGSSGPGTAIFYDDRSSLSRNNAFVVLASNGTALAADSLSADRITPNTMTIGAVRLNMSQATGNQRVFVSINGAAEYNNNNSTQTASGSNAASDMLIGRLVQFGLSLTGDMCELVIYSQMPSASARQAIVKYLTAKWQ
jgi:hypothetical protein